MKINTQLIIAQMNHQEINRIKPQLSSKSGTAQPLHILGVGLDNKDGHKRITRAEHFSVVGGSDETHSKMTKTLIKTEEDLKRKGRHLSSAHPEEISDLINKNSS